MDNSKYVFEMNENVPVKTADATPPVKGNYFMRGDKITYEGKKGVVKNAYGDVVVVQLEGDPKGDYRHLSYYTVKHARDARTSDAKSLHEMNTNELRDLAVSLGADKNKLYGTSKQALIIIIDKLKREKSNDMKTVDESKAYSVGYKSNGVYQSIAVIANSEAEAVRKAKEYFAKHGKEAEVFGASIGESIETIKMKGKPIIDSQSVF